MDIKELLVEGSTKKVYATDKSDEVIIEFQDTLPKGVSGKKASIDGKARENNAISSFFFEYLESFNVPTHFIRKLDAKSFLASRLHMLPIIVSVWNYADKELSKRIGFDEGKQLENPVVEMRLKNEKLKLPMINEYHAYALQLCDRGEMSNISRISTKVNAVLKSYFERRNIKLVSFNLEFGRSHNQILLGDEISPDTMVLWAVNEKGELDTKKLDISLNGSKKNYESIRESILGTKEK